MQCRPKCFQLHFLETATCRRYAQFWSLRQIKAPSLDRTFCWYPHLRMSKSTLSHTYVKLIKAPWLHFLFCINYRRMIKPTLCYTFVRAGHFTERVSVCLKHFHCLTACTMEAIWAGLHDNVPDRTSAKVAPIRCQLSTMPRHLQLKLSLSQKVGCTAEIVTQSSTSEHLGWV